MKASLNNNGDDFPAHENWMRFETTADLAVKYSEHVLAILENWSLGVRAGHHWVSQDGGSLTNCLLMVATVSAGEMGEVSGAKQSSKGGGTGAYPVVHYSYTCPSLPTTSTVHPSLLQVDVQGRESYYLPVSSCLL